MLSGHDCISVQKQGWKGIKNGELLALAAKEFNLFVTSDQNIRYQQNLAGRRIAIIVLSNAQRPVLKLHVALLVAAVNSVTPSSYMELQIPDR